MAYLDALAAVLPVLLLFALGALLRARGRIHDTTIDDLRGLILGVTLPAALFLTFLRVEVEPGYAVIAGAVFAACVVALAIGPLLGRAVGVPSPLFAPLITGFEAGMLGYGLYAAVFGAEELYHFAIVDIGQVVFVFFVLVTVLARRTTRQVPALAQTALQFARTPSIVAIVAGITAGSLGIGTALDGAPLGGGVLTALGLLAAMTTPLVAIVIGASLRRSQRGLAQPLRTVLVRLPLWVAAAIVFNAVVIEGLLGLDRLFSAAIFTMAVLPPPFVIPLYLREDSTPEDERAYVLDTISLATLVTLFAFSVVAVVYAG